MVLFFFFFFFNGAKASCAAMQGRRERDGTNNTEKNAIRELREARERGRKERNGRNSEEASNSLRPLLAVGGGGRSPPVSRPTESGAGGLIYPTNRHFTPCDPRGSFYSLCGCRLDVFLRRELRSPFSNWSWNRMRKADVFGGEQEPASSSE